MGVWRVWNPSNVPALPIVRAFSPRIGVSPDQTLVARFEKSPGATYTGGWILVNSAVNGANACYLAYPGGTELYLLNDTGSALQPGSITLTGSITSPLGNSQCTVISGTVATSSNEIVLTVNVSFASTFNGNKFVYSGMTDSTGNNTGWQPVGVMYFPSSAFGAAATTSDPFFAPSTTSFLAYAFCRNFAGNLLPACPVDVFTLPYTNSNAHFHTDGPTRPRSRLSTQSGGPFNSSVISLTTDALSGQTPIYAQTTDTGQQEIVLACATASPLPCASLNYWVGYQDLYYVAARSQWILIGGNRTGHGNDDFNHYMTSNAAYALLATTDQYLAAHPEQGTIAVNDMSLPFGGRFDIEAGNRWRNPHIRHMTGRSVDIRGSLGASMIPFQYQQEFKALCFTVGGATYAEVELIGSSAQHIHCDF